MCDATKDDRWPVAGYTKTANSLWVLNNTTELKREGSDYCIDDFFIHLMRLTRTLQPGKKFCSMRIIFVLFALLLHTTLFSQLKADFTADQTTGCTPLLVQYTDNSTGTPTEWLWDLGNGSVSTKQNPSGVYINPGTYTVKLRVKNLSGQDSIVKTNYITVYAKPTVDFSTQPSTGCVPLTVSFKDMSNAGSGTIQNWVWDFGDGTSAIDQNPVHTYTQPGTYSVSLFVINNFGCQQSVIKTSSILAADSVKADFTYNYTSVCNPPTTVNFTNTSTSSSPLTYQWDFGDGNQSTQTNSSDTYLTTGNYNVTLVATNTTGCSDTMIQPISIGNVKADFSMPPGACINEAIVLQDSSSPAPISATWDFGDGNTGTGLSVTHTYTALGTYQITYKASFGGCSSIVTKTIDVTNKPIAGFSSASVLKSCLPPLTVQFDNSSLNAANYIWDFGDGTSATGTSPQHTYTISGAFTVKLIAIGIGGCSDTISKVNFVRINQPKITSFSGFPFHGCAPSTVPFKANVTSAEAIATYLWDFGDGTTSSQGTPTHVYSTVGTYKVSLTVTTVSGCTDSYTLNSAVVIAARPTANFSATPLNACASEAVSFKDLSTGTVDGWYWVFGDGTSGTQQSPLHKYQDTGFFSVKLVASNNGCKDSITLNNYIHVSPPIANFITAQDCTNKYLKTFTDKSIGAVSWNWDFGDGTISNQQNNAHTYADTGVYTIRLIVTNGACADTATTVKYVIDENPTISITALHSDFCKNDSIQFTASNYNSAYVAGFKWIYGDGNSTFFNLNNAIRTHVYTQAGAYQPQLIVNDLNGCYDTVKSNLPINIYGPVASFTNAAGTCADSLFVFTDQSVSDGINSLSKWVWDYGDGNIDTLTAPPYQHRYADSGTYNIRLTVFDTRGCYDTAFKAASVLIGKPYADFNLLDSIRCTASAVSFGNLSAGLSLTYNWDFGDGNTSNQTAPTHLYATEGVYTVSLNVKDMFGCTDTIVKTSVVTISNPVAAFSISDSVATCPPLPVQVTNSSSGYNTITWNFGDGNTSALDQPFHLYTVPGQYDLVLIIQGYGNCFDTAKRSISIKGPYGTLQYTPDKGCFPVPVSFNAVAQNTISYVWDFGDGSTKNTSGNSTNYIYTTPGAFVPKLILEDSTGCKVPLQTTDTVFISGIQPKFSFNAQTGCDSSLVTFADSSYIVSFDPLKSTSWDFGDGGTSSSSSPGHFYNTAGNFIVTQTVTSTAGCTASYSFPVPVSINKAPKIVITSADSVCFTGSLNFSVTDTASIAEPLQWLWDLGNGNAETAQSFSYTYSASGVYNVSVISTATTTGCADTAQKNVTVIAPPPVNAGNDTTICLYTVATLNPSGAASYIWNSASTLSCTNCTNPLAGPSATATYFVTGADNFGCKASDSVVINVVQPTQVSLAVTGDTLCAGSSVQLSATGAEQYNWQPSTGLNNTAIGNPVASPSATTVYTVIGSDNNHCFADTAQVTVFVAPLPSVNITDSLVTINVGSSYNVTTTNSPDVVLWEWQPPTGLSCSNCGNPVAQPKSNITYTVKASNAYGCSATDNIRFEVLCNNANVFIPNTFSPNGDGRNEYFFPQGKGLFSIKSLRIFNRWGVMVFSKWNFNANSQTDGWDGKYNSIPQPSDVYVYVMDIVCDNGEILTYKGNLTLLK